MDINKRLSVHLEEERQSVFPAGRGIEVAMARGIRHRRQRRSGMLLGAVTTVFVAGFALVALKPSGTSLEATPPATIAPAVVAPVAGLPNGIEPTLRSDPFVWETAPATLGYSNRLFATDGSFYALSTAPGVQWTPGATEPLPQAIYTSDDGLAWDHVLLGDDLWAGEMAEHDGTLYLIGTAPGLSAIDVGARVGSSNDGGATWSYEDLPLVATEPEGLGEVLGRSTMTKLAAGQNGLLAIVSTNYWFDFQRLVPEEYRNTEFFETSPTTEGIQVVDYRPWIELEMACDEAMGRGTFGDTPATTLAPDEAGSEIAIEDLPEPCRTLETVDFAEMTSVVWSATWADLGVGPDDPTRFHEVFYSGDGSTWERREPGLGSQGHVDDLIATTDGFFAFGWEPLDTELAYARWGQRLWQSSDGRSWDVIDGLPESFSSRSAGVFDGRLVTIGAGGESGGREGVVVAMSDGTSWTTTDPSVLIPAIEEANDVWIASAGVGPLGVVIAVHTQPQGDVDNWPPDTYLLYSADLTSWAVVDLADVIDGGGTHIDAISVGEEEIFARLIQWSTGGQVTMNYSLVATIRE